MKILTTWLHAYLPELTVSDQQLADDLTLRGIAVDGVFDLGPGNGSLLEMDITTNRVDAMNHYGIAREAAAIYDIPLKALEVSLPTTKPATQPFPVRIEATDLCGRFTARVLRNINIVPSTGKIAQRFSLLEQKLISNAVDATNFVTMEMGHPTHAFDLDKLEGGIVIRRAYMGEKLRFLDGSERALAPDDLVVADEKKAVALAGVMGGWDTMITPATKNVLVEAAWFDPGTVRRSSRRHGLHTDASHRFERGADFNAAPLASSLVCEAILAAGGSIEGDLVDLVVPELAAQTSNRPPISLHISEVERILGKTADDQPIGATTIERYLTALGARMRSTSVDTYDVTLPSWRLDLAFEIDLIEEIARLHGYNRFANTLPSFSGGVSELPWSPKESFLRRTMRAAGYTETISSTFCSAADASLFAQQPNSIVQLGNPLSVDVGFLRPSLIPGMLSMLAHNLNREVDDLRLFEMGTVFTGGTERVQEKPSIAIGATGTAIVPHALGSLRDYSFYDLKGLMEELLSGFVIKSSYMDAFPAAAGLMPTWLHPGRAARLVVDGETIGYFGELAPQESQSRKLRQTIFIGEFNLARLYQHNLRQPAAQELSRFPAVVRDFSFTFPDAIRWQQIAQTIAMLGIPEMRSTEPREIFRDKQSPSDSYALLLRVVFQAQDRTLRLEELQEWARRIFAALMGLGGQPRFPLELLS